MRDDFKISSRQQIQGKKRRYPGILTLDDLPKSNVRYIQLIAQLKARYQTAGEPSDDQPRSKSEDSSV